MLIDHIQQVPVACADAPVMAQLPSSAVHPVNWQSLISRCLLLRWGCRTTRQLDAFATSAAILTHSTDAPAMAQLPSSALCEIL
jgi:hypothetical protein